MPIHTPFPSPTPRRRRRPLAGLAAGLVVLGLLTAAVPSDASTAPHPRSAHHRRHVPLRVGPTVPGLDVSHWQGTIDWSRVAATGRRFVFVKATDGDATVDPTFVTNRDGAEANGLFVGAYHFARPDHSRGDAGREARFFVGQVAPGPGDLVPVLDIETNGGLDQTEMIHWARTWVRVVHRLTGVMPMVYTSPYGWLSRFADTPLLAQDGARLWVAHWNVSSPTLPASDWDGNGWVVWQHSSTGHVAGIGTAVDLDRLLGTRLGPLIIRHLSIDVTGGAGAVTASPVDMDCRASCGRNVDPNASITLTATPDDHAYFTGWGGDCSGTDPTCTIAMHGDRDVTARFVTDITPPQPSIAAPARFDGPVVVRFDEPAGGVTPSSVVLREVSGGTLPATRVCRSLSGIVPCSGTNVRSVALTPAHRWTPGRDYQVVVDPAGVTPRVHDRLGNAAPTTPLPFEGPTGFEENALPVRQSWGAVTNASAYGGAYAVSRQRGATFAFPFRGRSVTWYTVTGPGFGAAEVTIDGRDLGAFDLWSAHRTLRVAKTFSGLSRGSHTIVVHVTGRKRAAAGDRWVAVDGFRRGGGVVANPRGVQRWREVVGGGTSGGRSAVEDVAGAALAFRFDGTGVDWTAVTGPDRGRALVYVDGTLVDTVDLYASTRTPGVTESVGGLTDGPHTLRIEPAGTAQAASAGTLIAIDRFDVT
jgi:GH25 family lysozyme M1 (1,4-beta-N-acetylmuramidase)